tara:strand:+ start:226 stop:447 length:222 start_codon:yes stop_codon:yes gene_type:complete
MKRGGGNGLGNKVNFKNFEREGAWVSYHKNGLLKSKGNYKNGRWEGAWVSYNVYGTVDKEFTGTYKDGKKISE